MARGDDLLEVIAPDDEHRERIRHVEHLPGREAIPAAWPAWSDPELVAAYASRGVSRPWSHQVEAAEAIRAGRTTVLATSTGSGKSLGFWLPVVTAVRDGRRAEAASPGRISRMQRPSALYLSPTKALAADQLSSLTSLLAAGGITDVAVDTCDGDTPFETRRWIQAHSDVVLTNPDFLHHSLLPRHDRWARLLRSLRYVVVDEGHAFRGVFGAHVALVLRRLQRLALHYSATGTPPVLVVASATSADSAVGAARLSGGEASEIVAVTRDGSPAGPKTFVLWEPPEIVTLPGDVAAARDTRPVEASAPSDDDAWTVADPAVGTPWDTGPGWSDDEDPVAEPWDVGPRSEEVTPPEDRTPGNGDEAPSARRHAEAAQPVELIRTPAPEPLTDGDKPRRSAGAEAAELLAHLTGAGARTLAFTRSRRGAETVAQSTRSLLRQERSPLAGQVAAYRGGYLPEERRDLEDAIRSGELRALATTNALELGVDISGLDAVITIGWPGTRASVWQQAGRAGRAGSEGLVVFVARQDPLDTFLVSNPTALFGAPVESNVFDPSNRYVLAPHLCAAAAELPLRPDDVATFGSTAGAVLDELVEIGFLRRRPTGWYWTRAEAATDLTDLRGSGGGTVTVVDGGTGTVLGTMDAEGADSALHEGAVYVHQGRSLVVVEYRPAELVALVAPRTVDFGTWATSDKSVTVVHERDSEEWQTGAGPVRWGFGDVEVASQVTEYQRKRLKDQLVLGTYPLDLPVRSLTTAAVWWSVPTSMTEAAGLDSETLPGALHAAEHASIGLLPLLATCDRADLGGLSTALHPDTDEATVFVYDAFPGGAGFAEHGFEVAQQWLTATLEAIEGCPCSHGCPACVQSPKCGNGNEPLDKDGAARLLRVLLDRPAHRPDPG